MTINFKLSQNSACHWYRSIRHEDIDHPKVRPLPVTKLYVRYEKILVPTFKTMTIYDIMPKC